MTQQLIGIGDAANDGTGDNLRLGGDKINDNFTELYGLVSETINAIGFSGATNVEKIQGAINQAVAAGAARVYVPAALLPFDASQVVFNDAVWMVREGGNWAEYDVWAYGAAPDGVTDATVEMQAAIDGASAAGGGVVRVPAGSYVLSGALNIPHNVDLLGTGKFATLFVCGATGCLRFGTGGGTSVSSNYGGTSGNFRLYSTTSTVTMLYVGLCTARSFHAIDINGGNGGTGDGLRLEQTQNCSFVEVDSARCGGSGVVLDYGAGGNVFYKCEFNLNGYANGRSTYTGPNTGLGYPTVPQHNTFHGCLFEGTTSTMVACFAYGAGSRCDFDSCHFSLFGGTNGHADLYGTDIPVLWIYKEHADALALANRLYLRGTTAIFGSAPSVGVVYRGYGIQIENSPGESAGLNCYIGDGVLISSCKSALYMSDSSHVHVGNFVLLNNTARFTSFGGALTEGAIVKYRAGHHELTGVDLATIVQKIIGATGQTASLAEWWSSTALVASVSNGGTFSAIATVIGAVMRTSGRGTVGTPAFAFTNDTDCGMWSPTTNEVAISTAGAKRVHWNATGGMHFSGGTPVAITNVTGSRGGNAALASLLTALASLGLITDGTSA